MDRQFTITVFLFISHPPPPPRSPHELRVIFLNFASIYYSLSSSRDTWSKCFCKVMLGEALTLSQGSSVYDNGEKSLRNLRSLCMCWLQPPPPVFLSFHLRATRNSWIIWQECPFCAGLWKECHNFCHSTSKYQCATKPEECWRLTYCSM